MQLIKNNVTMVRVLFIKKHIKVSGLDLCIASKNRIDLMKNKNTLFAFLRKAKAGECPFICIFL